MSKRPLFFVVSGQRAALTRAARRVKAAGDGVIVVRRSDMERATQALIREGANGGVRSLGGHYRKEV